MNNTTQLNCINKIWEYSELSKLAQNHGGPRALLESTCMDGYIKGCIDMHPIAYRDGYKNGTITILTKVVLPLTLITLTSVSLWGYELWKQHKKVKKVHMLSGEDFEDYLTRWRAERELCEMPGEKDADIVDINNEEDD